MKSICLFFFFVLSGIKVYSQVACSASYSVCLNGIWGAWSEVFSDYYYGRFGEFVEIGERRHPSEYHWKLKLDNFVRPSSTEIKRHYKNKEWWSYEGTLEYCVSDEYPDAVSQLKKFGYLAVAPWLHDVSKGQTPYVRKTIRVKVDIAPYKDYPRCYNIHFRNISNPGLSGNGMAIDFKTNALNW